jgi:cytochrome c oxidase cbb3-type subunit III
MNSPTPDVQSEAAAGARMRRRIYWGLAIAAILVVAGAAYSKIETSRLNAALLVTPSEEIPQKPRLVSFALKSAPALYKEHCASCHGADMKGDRSRGVPNLVDGVWLYGTGTVTDIETTILYGIRSGHPKSHNLTEMPGLGRIGQISKDQVHDVVEYLLLISGQPHDEAAAERGRRVYNDQGVCYDCHAADAYGVSDYGTPGLTGRGGAWIYGGDRATLYKSVFDGRHGLCPYWIGKLSFAQIRALAVYLYEASHPASANDPKHAMRTTTDASTAMRRAASAAVQPGKSQRNQLECGGETHFVIPKGDTPALSAADACVAPSPNT